MSRTAINGPAWLNQQEDLALTLRRSARAKRLILRMVPGKGLEVVVPQWAGQVDVDRLLQEKASWIRRTAARLQAQGADLSGAIPDLPDQLELRALDQALPISYAPRPGNLVLRENAGRIAFSGPTDQRSRVFRRLREYVRDKAKSELPPRIRAMSETTGLHFDEVAVRCQRTRWGSCARKGRHTAISLNAKLLFLPSTLCDQVLLHELCHLVHHDHSEAYWALVARLNPHARVLERELGSGHRFVPPWWTASF